MKKIARAYLKKSILLGSDLVFVLLTLPLALFIRLEPTNFFAFLRTLSIAHFAIVLLAYLFAFVFFRTYRTIVRLANLYTALRVAAAVFLGGSISFVATNYLFSLPLLPRSTYIIQMLLVAPACITIRFSIRIAERFARGTGDGIRTLVYGAGLTTDRFLPIVLRQKGEIRVLGILDDDPAKRGSEVQGIRVIGGLQDVERLVRRYEVEQVILSMPSVPGSRLREIAARLYDLNLKVKVLPAPEDYVNAVNTATVEFRDLNIEDLLRRPSRSIDPTAIARILKGKCVLVTGGGGSIGSELVRQIAAMFPSQLIVNDASEFALYKISEEIRSKHPELTFTSHLGNLADDRICAQLFASHQIDAVFHACAYKHVPLVEENIPSAILNNIHSARNTFREAQRHGTERVVLISSDKAVRPTNVMGATKRLCELLALWYAGMQPQTGSSCGFSAVRFGNVLGSSGSVVPKFIEQIRDGGPITITHPEITRYFMLIPEAVSLVLQAATTSNSGEIFVLNMGKPIKIVDMARDLIRLMGKRVDKDVAISFTGLRPGEKLYEELQLDTENIEPVNDDFFKLVRVLGPDKDFMNEVDDLLQKAASGKSLESRSALFDLVQKYERVNINSQQTPSI